MAPITLDMLRRRAEHNEGMVSTLEEVSLHQQDIEKIEALGQLCRHLKILYLQNNLIGKLENLHRLKEVEYLNVAVNNLQKIENLQRCESLTKLDMTVNFIPKAGLLTVESLQANYQLKELFLMGNPCTEWGPYREFVVATLDSLQKLDGQAITPSERIKAKQVYPEHRARLVRELEEEGVDVNAASFYDDARYVVDDYEEWEDEDGQKHDNRPWCPQTRLADARDLAEQRERDEEKKKKHHDDLMGIDPTKKPPRREGFDPIVPGERIYQKNEGGYKFTFLESEDGGEIILDLAVPKHMDTTLFDVDVQPSFVRILVKGKLTQLLLDEEVLPDKSRCERSKMTGHLCVRMPKAAGASAVLQSYQAEQKAQEEAAAAAAQQKKKLGGIARGELQGITGKGGNGLAPQLKEMRVTPQAQQTEVFGDDDDDDDEPPPL